MEDLNVHLNLQEVNVSTGNQKSAERGFFLAN